jgi:hypothetical protein
MRDPSGPCITHSVRIQTLGEEWWAAGRLLASGSAAQERLRSPAWSYQLIQGGGTCEHQ